ncbi:hypothetical protein JHK82_038752 [Glycine max]|nr:hypothetical protein JHK82_038752 [Glycine max]
MEIMRLLRSESGSTKCQSKTKQNSNSSERKAPLKTSASNVGKPISNSLKSFTFNDLREATKNFRHENLIGEGGFGFVYKGWIDENTCTPTKPGTGIVVAIKKLKPESFQGHREWLICEENRTCCFAFEDDRPGFSEETLVDWARPFLSDSRRILRIMDSRLGGQYSKKGARAAAALVLQCLNTDPKYRPTMVTVLAELEALHSSNSFPRTPKSGTENHTTEHSSHSHKSATSSNKL